MDFCVGFAESGHKLGEANKLTCHLSLSELLSYLKLLDAAQLTQTDVQLTWNSN